MPGTELYRDFVLQSKIFTFQLSQPLGGAGLTVHIRLLKEDYYV